MVSQNIKILTPRHETLDLSGEISYGESQKAWNMIRLKKELLSEFPQLKERRSKFGYQMLLYRSFEDLKKAIKEMEQNGEGIPLLLWFGRK